MEGVNKLLQFARRLGQQSGVISIDEEGDTQGGGNSRAKQRERRLDVLLAAVHIKAKEDRAEGATLADAHTGFKRGPKLASNFH